MSAASDSSGDFTVVAPEGDLDIATVRDFRATLTHAADEPGPGVVVDLSGVDFIDSTGLGAVIEAHHRLRVERRRLAVVAPGGTAAALILNLSGLRDELSVFESREAAVAG